MKLRSFLFGIVFTMLWASSSLAQFSFHGVSVNVGLIRTLFPDVELYTDYQRAFYSELEVDAKILGSFIRGGVYWGYWNDGVKSLHVIDSVIYSYRGHIVGTRFTFLPKKVLDDWLLPVGIFAGAARHFIEARCVGGADFVGNTCNSGHYQDFTRNINTLEVGLISEIHIFGPLNIQGEVQQFIPLGNNEFDRYQKNRKAYSVGLAVSF